MQYKGKITFSLAVLPILVLTLFICAFIPAKKNGYEIRFPAQNDILEIAEIERAAWIKNCGEDGRIWGVRGAIAPEPVNPALIYAYQLVLDAAQLATLKNDPHMAKEDVQFAPLLEQDGATQPSLFAAQPYNHGDILDPSGQPMRWRLPDNLLAGYIPLPPPAPEPIKQLVLPKFPKLPATGNSQSYRAMVENFARRYNLSVPLVMAIIHSESDFKPTLVSNKSAMGLMQLLPSTASDEVHRFLYGRRGKVSFAELSVPETNIHYGTAYLHILLNRYFSEVKNSEVREACAIAAYNMGPNRFVRLYGSSPSQAAARINTMGVEEFFRDLYSRLPVRETKFFVNKVQQMKRHYAVGP